MAELARLIKNKTISFTEELISYYPTLKINEEEVLILIHLYRQLEKNDNLLVVKNLAEKMTLNENDISQLLIHLVKLGYVELLISEGEEVFHLDGAYDAIANAMSENEQTSKYKSRQDLLSQLILYVEATYAKPCSPADLAIVNHWLDLGYSSEAIKSAILEGLKAKKLHLRYADAILANKKTKSERETVTYDEDLKKMLDEMYVKR